MKFHLKLSEISLLYVQIPHRHHTAPFNGNKCMTYVRNNQDKRYLCKHQQWDAVSFSKEREKDLIQIHQTKKLKPHKHIDVGKLFHTGISWYLAKQNENFEYRHNLPMTKPHANTNAHTHTNTNTDTDSQTFRSNLNFYLKTIKCYLLWHFQYLEQV